HERMTIDLSKRSAADLASFAGAPSPGAFSVEGTIAAQGGDAPRADVAMKLDGYTPPHPRELDGIVFGTTTSLRAKLTLESLANLALGAVAVETGALKLVGSGHYRWGLGALALDLDGAIPCSALAASSASAHFGPLAAGLLGNLARSALRGNV